MCYSKLDTSGLPQCYPLPNKQTKVPTDLLEEKNTNLAEIEKLFCSSITTEQQDLWPVGESYALEQLDHFIEDSVSQYKVERDFPT